MKRNGVFVFPNDFGRNLAADYFFEDRHQH
jgi:hypothetical protein